MLRHPSARLGLPLVALIWAGGCLDREEGITVLEDGSIRVVHELSGDAGDLNGGAAWLPLGPDYSVRRFTRETKDGKRKHCAVAEAHYASAAAMPERFAPDDHPLADAALHFTTDLHVEEQSDGVHYLFVRRYVGRNWGRYAFERRRAFPDAVEQLMDSGPIEKLAPEQQRQVLAAFADFERRKLQAWVEFALADVARERDDVTDATRWRGQLLATDAINSYAAGQLSGEQLLGLLDLAPSVLEETTDAILTAWIGAALEAAGSRLPTAAQGRLRERFDYYRHDFEVSEDLRDENFKLTVTMPGKILRSNGQGQHSQARWSFSGQELCDGDRVLIVESVVAP